MSLMRSALTAVLVLSSVPVLAQFEACPGGTQVGQDCRGGSCMPICAYGESSEQQAAPSPRIVDRYQVWDDRFGAIARDVEGPLGTAEGHLSKEDAESAASADCVKRGGDPQRCRFIEISYSNSCVVYTWGGGRSQAFSGADPEEIKGLALQACEDVSGTQCDVIYEGCSMAEERWTYEKPAE